RHRAADGPALGGSRLGRERHLLRGDPRRRPGVPVQAPRPAPRRRRGRPGPVGLRLACDEAGRVAAAPGTWPASERAMARHPPRSSSASGGLARPVAAAHPPATADLGVLARAAAGCTACELYRRATQTVFGAGPEEARAMLVGEQPGDQEDVAGRPFVGPAGRLLVRALEAAGVAPASVYLTNAVQHFK